MSMPDNPPQMPPGDWPPQPQPPHPPFPPAPRPPQKSSYATQMSLGCVSFVLLLIGLGWAVFNYSVMARRSPYQLLNALLAPLLIGLGIAIMVWRARRGRGLVVGFLIGLLIVVGLVVLAVGLCFANFRM